MLVSILLVCAILAVGITSFAETDTTLKIASGNLAYNEMTHITFTLSGTPADGLEAGIAVWDKDVTEPNADNVSYFVFEKGSLEGVTYYKTKGIPASEMSAQITVAPATRTEGDETNGSAAVAGDKVTYSIYDYIKSRLDDDGVTEAQLKLYTNVVTYGNYAEKVLNKTVTTPILIANGGYAEGSKYGLALPEGDTALIRANAINTDGEYFLYWTDADGNKIYDRVTNITLGENSTTYTANYGDASESAYAGSTNFNSYETASFNLIPSGATIANSGDTFFYITGETTHLNGLVTAKGFTQVTAADDATVVLGDTLSIKEENGSKYLSYEKNVIKSGITGARIVFNNTDTKNEERVEWDLRFNNTDWVGMELHLYFSNGTSSQEIHPAASYATNGDFAIYGVSAGNFARGETFTLAVEIVAEGIEFYVNGNYVTTKTTSWGEDYHNAAYFRGMGITPNTGCGGDIDFLGVSFVDTDMIPAE